MFRPPFRPVLVVAAVTATALLGACSDDTAAPGPTADATTTTSTAAPTTTTEPSAPTTPEDEVAAADLARRVFRHEALRDGLAARGEVSAARAVVVPVVGAAAVLVATEGVLQDVEEGRHRPPRRSL